MAGEAPLPVLLDQVSVQSCWLSCLSWLREGVKGFPAAEEPGPLRVSPTPAILLPKGLPYVPVPSPLGDCSSQLSSASVLR